MAKSKSLFDTFKRAKKVVAGESIRFRDASGKLTKFDGRKKLVAEIWKVDKVKRKGKTVTISRRTNRVLNKVKKGKPIPEKINAKFIKKKKAFLEFSRKGLKSSSEIKNARILVNAHFTIEDNLEMKIPQMINDIVKWSKKGNGAYATIEFSLDTENGKIYEVIRLVVKGTRGDVVRMLASAMIAKIYSYKYRMSSIADSWQMGDRGKYLRSLQVKFSWTETRRLSDM